MANTSSHTENLVTPRHTRHNSLESDLNFQSASEQSEFQKGVLTLSKTLLSTSNSPQCTHYQQLPIDLSQFAVQLKQIVDLTDNNAISRRCILLQKLHRRARQPIRNEFQYEILQWDSFKISNMVNSPVASIETTERFAALVTMKLTMGGFYWHQSDPFKLLYDASAQQIGSRDGFGGSSGICCGMLDWSASRVALVRKRMVFLSQIESLSQSQLRAHFSYFGPTMELTDAEHLIHRIKLMLLATPTEIHRLLSDQICRLVDHLSAYPRQDHRPGTPNPYASAEPLFRSGCEALCEFEESLKAVSQLFGSARLNSA